MARNRIPNYLTLSANKSAVLSTLRFSLLLMVGKMSAKRTVPANTSAVPSQWTTVNVLLKYAMEMSNDRNLRSVTTNITVSDVQSNVSINTDLMHTYLAENCVMEQPAAVYISLTIYKVAQNKHTSLATGLY